MRALWWGLAILAALWLATGFYVVQGDEQAVVRRFGRLRLPTQGAGWHYDLPWPCTRVDRVKVHAVRTFTIGVPAEAPAAGDSLTALFRDRQSEFLTGDKNIVNVQVQVQYTVIDPAQYLFAAAAPEIALRLLVESLVADAVARSGVDYVQPLGLTELREKLTLAARLAVEQRGWGIVVEDVAIGGVFPPVEVKEAFLDVSNVRAEKERGIHEEQTRAEQRVAQARADARELLDRAAAEKHRRLAVARGEADRFLKIIAQFKQESSTGTASYAQVRYLAIQRLYTATLEELLPKLAGHVLLDTQQPADLTIFPQKPAQANPATPASP